MHVLFQENAWVDTAVATDWAANTLTPFISEVGIRRFVLFADKLTAQESDAFKVELSSTGGLAYFGLRHGTEF